MSITKYLLGTTKPTKHIFYLLMPSTDYNGTQKCGSREEIRNLLMRASDESGFTVIEIFYYRVGDSLRIRNIINFIKRLGGDITIITNSLPVPDELDNLSCEAIIEILV